MSTEGRSAPDEAAQATETADIHDSEAVDPCGCAPQPSTAAAAGNAVRNLSTTEPVHPRLRCNLRYPLPRPRQAYQTPTSSRCSADSHQEVLNAPPVCL